MYVRYADDFVVLILGNRKDALGIRDKINTFLKENLGLDLNLEKTIVSPNSAGFQFLGALCRKRDNSSIFNKSKNQLKVNITRRSSLRLAVDVPTKALVEKLVKNGYAKRNNRGEVFAKGLTHMIHLDHHNIIQFFNSKIRGILTYYSFAGNRAALHSVF